MGSLIGAIAGPVIGGLLGSDASEDAANTQAASASNATAAQREMFNKQVELQAPFREAGLSANNQLMYLLGLSPTSSGSSSGKSYEQLRAELLPQYTKQQSRPGAMAGGETAFMQGIAAGLSPGANGVFGNWKMRDGVFEQPVSSIDETGLEAAIRARMGSGQTQRMGDPNDPAFGSLMRDFSMADFEADPGYQFRMDEGTRAVEGGAAARGGLLSGAAQKALLKYGQGAASQEYGNAFNRFTGQQTNKYNRLAGIVNTGQGATNQVGNAAQNFGNSQASNIIGAGNAQAAGQIGSANALVGGVNGAFNNYQNNELMNMIRNPGAGSTSWGNVNNQYFTGNMGMGD